MARNPAAQAAAPATIEELLEDEEPSSQQPSAAAGDEDPAADDAAADEYSQYSDEYDEEDPLQQISQLLITEDGEAVSDVLQGVRDALVKQNKILFRLCTLLEQRGAQNE